MCNKIKVIDAICGEGKTTSLINYINGKKEDKFLYITPFLSEVNRIKEECFIKNFKSPEYRGSKMYDIKRLFSNGENIVSTHSLFKKFDEETIDLTSLNDYTLIMDEVAEVIQVVDISKYDLDTLLEKYVEVKNNGMIEWISSDYEGKFEYYKKQCELNTLFLYRPNEKLNPVLLWLFPISVFNAFKDVIVSTYLFNYQLQKYYYDYYNFKYEYLYIKNFELTTEKQIYNLSKYKNKINICENEKLNSIGDSYNSLSYNWYNRNNNNVLIKILKNNCENYFKNIVKTPSKFNMWTTFKEYKNIVKGKGYTKGFVSLSMRATNLYKDKKTIAYLSNRYFNPIIKNFFVSNGIQINEDGFALSELLQFLFRSQIRIGKKINLYIPNSRMRNILKKWINNI